MATKKKSKPPVAPVEDKKDGADAAVTPDADAAVTPDADAPVTPDADAAVIPDADVTPDASGSVSALADDLFGADGETPDASEGEDTIKTLRMEVESLKSVVTEQSAMLTEMKAAWIEIWGSAEDMKELLGMFQTAAKSFKSTSEVGGRMEKLEETILDMQLGLGKMMLWTQNITMKWVGDKVNSMTKQELSDIGVSLDPALPVPTPAPGPASNGAKYHSPVPSHAPGGS